ncbi:MAG TPA: response regulator transcription factor [Roseiflexaceae bacterium]|nr:response regulator transcription factor [Roseiflexaceae bacterium]
MSQLARILMVDDEAAIRLTLGTMLTRAGYDVTSAGNGDEAIEWLERQSFDLLLVDLKMPGMDGMQVVAAARARQSDISAIVLTGHGSLETAVEGLHLGIFDYLLKTSEPGHVIERVKAALAARAQALRQRSLLDVVGTAVQELRGGPQPGDDQAPGGSAERLLVVGALQLDTWRQVATLAGRTLPLTPTEFRVLLCLAEHAGNMLSYTQLVRCAQGYDSGELEASELIKPHIHHLRQKLEPDPSAPRYILNVRGKGYLLSPVGE